MEVQLTPPVFTEIVRSFAYKVNAGNYESRDFFCSQKAECKIEDAEKTSVALYEFCKNQVLNSVRAWKDEQNAQRASR